MIDVVDRRRALKRVLRDPDSSKAIRLRDDGRNSLHRLRAPNLHPAEVANRPAPAAEPAAYQPLSLEDVEKQHILRTLRHTDWNKSQAATILQIERSTLDREIKLYELKR